MLRLEDVSDLPGVQLEFPLEEYVPGALYLSTIQKYDRRSQGDLKVGDPAPNPPVVTICWDSEQHTATSSSVPGSGVGLLDVSCCHTIGKRKEENDEEVGSKSGKVLVLNFGSFS